jgi:MFS family permease
MTICGKGSNCEHLSSPFVRPTHLNRATAVVPTYFSEISRIEVRGAIGTCHQLGITVGILLSQALSTPSLHLLGTKELWKWLFFLPVACGLIEVLILPFSPESPSYLHEHRGEKAASEALSRLMSEDAAQETLEMIRQEAAAEKVKGDGQMTMWKLLMDVSLRKQLVVGMTVQLMMQFSGIDAVFFYSTKVFTEVGVQDPELATTCLGVINVIVTIVALQLMDSAGRKALLTYSWIGMCSSYILLTISFVFQPYYEWMNGVSFPPFSIVFVRQTQP